MSKGTGGDDVGSGAEHENAGAGRLMPARPEMPALQVEPYASLCARVYTRTGRKAHLLKPLASPNSHVTALCGTGPEWFESWRGAGSQQEHELAASLTVCKYCERVAVAEDEAARRRAERQEQEATAS